MTKGKKGQKTTTLNIYTCSFSVIVFANTFITPNIVFIKYDNKHYC